MNTSEQPAPRPGGAPVTPVARKWFIDTLGSQVDKGEAKYGVRLHSHNGRDALQDAMDELVDGVQYLAHARMERDELHDAIRRWLICRDVYGSILADDPAGVEEAAAGLQAATAALERVARKVTG